MTLRSLLDWTAKAVIISIIILAAVMFLASAAHAQSKPETIANFGLTSIDMAQTCYHLATNPLWREHYTPSQHCPQIVAMNFGRATIAFALDRYLVKHNHPMLAHFQIVSAGMAAGGLVITFHKDF